MEFIFPYFVLKEIKYNEEMEHTQHDIYSLTWRMSIVNTYRKCHKNRWIRGIAKRVRTPKAPRTEVQLQRLMDFRDDLENYKMRDDHELIEHVKIVNKKIQKVIFHGYGMNENEKYLALFNTLPEKLANLLEGFWTRYEKEKDKGTEHIVVKDFRKYDATVYEFLEYHTWINMCKSARLGVHTTLRFNKNLCVNSCLPKYDPAFIFKKVRFENSIPRGFKYIHADDSDDE